MTRQLADKIAIVTGGATGIGKAIVERFVAEEATVVFTDINEASGNSLKMRLTPPKPSFSNRIQVTKRIGITPSPKPSTNWDQLIL